ncbi:MAG: hypothetical protein GY714_09660 [Desulfobacterales bacterium]|nr:hypothetical protein [Desulfobacterales bacterium]
MATPSNIPCEKKNQHLKRLKESKVTIRSILVLLENNYFKKIKEKLYK